MSVVLEELQIFIKERIVAEWVDETGTASTLGSCLLINKQKPEFLMRVGSDSQGRIHIHFSLMTTITVAGKRREREMLMVIPPDALHKDVNFANALKSLKTSKLGDASLLSPSALHEAGITESEEIIRVQFSLLNKGFVIMRKTTSETIKPTTKTSAELILGLQSLSNVLSFNVYMRPSDYARCGLKKLHEILCNSCTGPYCETYLQQGAMLVDWDKLDYNRHWNRQPPPYREESAEPRVTVQAPQSPLISVGKKISRCPEEVVIAETPVGTPVRGRTILPSPVPVLHSIFSSIEADLESNESNSSIFDWDLENIQGETEQTVWDSDEERYAREVSQLRYDSSMSEALQLELKEWMKGAVTINRDVYKHRLLASRLSALGKHARESNLKAFDATKCWCSTLLFYDPAGSDKTSRLWDEANRWLISDMSKLIFWANELHRSAEMLSREVRHELVELGCAARAIVLQSGRSKYVAKYEDQRAVCVASLLCDFGNTSAGITAANTKPVTSEVQKRGQLLGNDAVPSKRVRA